MDSSRSSANLQTYRRSSICVPSFQAFGGVVRVSSGRILGRRHSVCGHEDKDSIEHGASIVLKEPAFDWKLRWKFGRSLRVTKAFRVSERAVLVVEAVRARRGASSTATSNLPECSPFKGSLSTVQKTRRCRASEEAPKIVGWVLTKATELDGKARRTLGVPVNVPPSGEDLQARKESQARRRRSSGISLAMVSVLDGKYHEGGLEGLKQFVSQMEAERKGGPVLAGALCVVSGQLISRHVLSSDVFVTELLPYAEKVVARELDEFGPNHLVDLTFALSTAHVRRAGLWYAIEKRALAIPLADWNVSRIAALLQGFSRAEMHHEHGGIFRHFSRHLIEQAERGRHGFVDLAPVQISKLANAYASSSVCDPKLFEILGNMALERLKSADQNQADSGFRLMELSRLAVAFARANHFELTLFTAIEREVSRRNSFEAHALDVSDLVCAYGLAVQDVCYRRGNVGLWAMAHRIFSWSHKTLGPQQLRRLDTWRLAALLKSFTDGRYYCSTLFETVVGILESRVHEMRDEDAVSLLQGLAAVRHNADRLLLKMRSAGVLERIRKSGMQHVGPLAWCLCVMQNYEFLIDVLPAEIPIESCETDSRLRQLYQLAFAVRLDAPHLVPSLPPWLFKLKSKKSWIEDARRVGSVVETNVKQVLSRLTDSFEWKFGVGPYVLDIVFPEQALCVDVVGPGRYVGRFDDHGNVMEVFIDGQTAMKHRLATGLGWGLFVIPADEWSSMDNEKDDTSCKTEFLLQKLCGLLAGDQAIVGEKAQRLELASERL